MMTSQKSGIEMPTTPSVRASLSAPLPRRVLAATPSGMAMTIDMSSPLPRAPPSREGASRATPRQTGGCDSRLQDYHLSRIAEHQAQPQEDEHRHAEQDGYREYEPPRQVAGMWQRDPDVQVVYRGRGAD